MRPYKVLVTPRRNKKREERIAMEIVVDAHDESERAMGWYAYLEDQLQFPFAAKCVRAISFSPLRVGERVVVTEMADADACGREIFVTIQFAGRSIAVPLSQLRPMAASAATKQGVDDWHYWVSQGYEF